MVNYKKTKIYYIPIGDERYYGHTTQSLCRRKAGHVFDSKRYPDYKLYKAIANAGMKQDDINLIWVEDYPCETKEQAEARERYYIEKYATLNTMIPQRTWKEYYEQNKELIAEKKKEYRKENKERLAEKWKTFYNNNKEKESARKAEFYKQNADKLREKYHQNKEAIKIARRERYEQNKEAINAKRREQYALKKVNH